MFRRPVAICLLTLLSVCQLTLAQNSEPNIKRISWQHSTFDGFVQALENNKPLVLVILSNPSHVNDDGKNISNSQRVVLDDLQVHAMADEAVFVMAEFDHRLSRSNDEFVNRIMKHAEVKMLPAILVIANRSDKLSVARKLEGIYQPEELVVEVRGAIRQVAKSLGQADATDLSPTLPPAQAPLEHNPYELQPKP